MTTSTSSPQSESPLVPADGGAGPDGPYDPELRAAGQLTSPTWELELLISGAVVFATFQLPGTIEALFTRAEPHATSATLAILFIVALYAKAIAFTLIATFLTHLVARAQWVALMGLHSVFPRGVRWEEVRVGPVAKATYRSFVPDLPRVIAKLDNFCSVLFSVGLLFVLIFAYSTVLAAAIGGIAWLLAQGLAGGRYVRRFFLVLSGAFVGLQLVAGGVDRWLAGRLVPGSRVDRVLRRTIWLAFTLNLARLIGPMMWTLVTNVGRRRAQALLYVALVGLLLLAAVDRLVQKDRLAINSSDYFGRSREHGVGYELYESQRQPGKFYPGVPSIQSDIVTDPYVRLFIPYDPLRHNAAVARACPGVRPLQRRGLRIGGEPYLPDSLVEPVLACLARIHRVTLDGTPRPDVPLAFYEHPGSGLNGMIAYIPVDSLPRGRHVVTLLPAPPEEPRPGARAPEAIVIPFWK